MGLYREDAQMFTLRRNHSCPLACSAAKQQAAGCCCQRGSLAVGLLELIVLGIPGYPQDFVVVFAWEGENGRGG